MGVESIESWQTFHERLLRRGGVHAFFTFPSWCGTAGSGEHPLFSSLAKYLELPAICRSIAPCSAGEMSSALLFETTRVYTKTPGDRVLLGTLSVRDQGTMKPFGSARGVTGPNVKKCCHIDNTFEGETEKRKRTRRD